MNSAWVRWNVILMYMMMFAAFIVFSTHTTNQFLHPSTAVPAKVDFNQVKVVRLRSDRQRDRAVLAFECDLDLTPLFDWNTKQIFVFLEASYLVPGRGLNRIVVWDRVVHTKEEAKFQLKQMSKYEMDDVNNGLYGNTNVSLKLGWDTMPYVGFVGKGFQLHTTNLGSKQFAVPAKYSKFV